jgi:hypothetical protein
VFGHDGPEVEGDGDVRARLQPVLRNRVNPKIVSIFGSAWVVKERRCSAVSFERPPRAAAKVKAYAFDGYGCPANVGYSHFRVFDAEIRCVTKEVG